MPNKAICSIIAITVLNCAQLFTLADTKILYTSLFILAGLGGLAIWRNNHKAT